MVGNLRIGVVAAGFGIVAALPGVLAVAALAVAGRLAFGLALAAGAAVLVATVTVVSRLAIVAARARAAVALLGSGDAPAGDVANAIERLGRMWRSRLDDAEGQRQAAEAVIAALPDPLILVDERRRILQANAAASAALGNAPEPRDLAAALRDPAVLGAADEVLAGAAARAVEFAVTAPVEREWRAHIARIDRRPSPEGAAAVLTLHDITALKRAEAMRADFVANASHELRTPLATLIGFIETLRGAAHDDAEARDRFLAIMHEQASRMTRLVADLLSLSQIELHEHEPPEDGVELAPLLRQATAAFELRAAQRRMHIDLSLPATLPAVRGDADELAQVFQNLLDNAIKYGREGTAITVGAGPVRQLPGQGEFVAVAVEDHGEGIAREHLARLTERFYRVDNARSRALGGTGLGLAIVKHILNRHRGFLEIESTPGRGSVFTVNLQKASVSAEIAAEADAGGRG
jgi:two-component system, OmpR family, phosphate regulon sensor histidine kinase PhoR